MYWPAGFMEDSMAGENSPNGSGPDQDSGSFRSSGVSSCPSGSPVVRSLPPAVSGSGAGGRSWPAGLACSSTGAGISTVFSQVGVSCFVTNFFRTKRNAETAYSNLTKHTVHWPVSRESTKNVASSPCAAWNACASSTRCRSTGTPAVLKAFRVACNAGDWSV